MNYFKFEQVDVNNIKPKGWLREFLERQMGGLTGHLDEIAYPFNTVVWAKNEQMTKEGYCVAADDQFNNMNWWGYEQVAYWVDGHEKAAALLGLSSDKNKVRDQLLGALKNADADGYIGPSFLKDGNDRIRWPHVVFFRALITLYEQTHDESIVQQLEKHYLNDTFVYDSFRDIANVEIMLWVYSKTKNPVLLEKAETDYKSYCQKAQESNEHNDRVDFTKEKPYNHGVTYNEIAKQAAILYAYTKKEEYLHTSIEAYRKIDDYFMLPGGCHCSNEFMISNEYFQCIEMCDVTDYTWSLGYMLMATADGRYADKIEKCIFNAGIGAVLEDFSAMQYLSCANQVLATDNSCHNFFHVGGDWMQYLAECEVQCCLGNCNRFMPNYAHRMWMQKEDRVFLCLFGESDFQTTIQGKKVKFEEKTNYPFDDTLTITYRAEEDAETFFAIRIPAWTTKYSLTINGKEVDCKIEKGFAYIKNPLKDKDVIRLKMKSDIQCVSYKNSSVTFEKGPLVYALGGKGQREKCWKEKEQFPSCSMRADFKWNYAIEKDCTPVFSAKAVQGYVWDADTCPYEIKVQGREIKGWETLKLQDKKIKNVWNLYDRKYTYVTGTFEFTPKLPTKKFVAENASDIADELTLIPYACAKMRMTVLPKL